MDSKKTFFSKDELLIELKNIMNRIDDYDWEYRISRFNEKINVEKDNISTILNEIKSSEK